MQRLHPETELPPGWSFALDRVVLRDTTVRLGGAAAEDAEALDVTIREARAATRRRRASAFGRAPNLRVDAVVGDGRLLIDGSSDIRDDGVAVDARVYAKACRCDRSPPTVPPSCRSPPSAGRLSALLQYQRDPGRRDRLTGRLRGRRLPCASRRSTHRPSRSGAWTRRSTQIDLLQRRVAIGTLTLHGAALAVRPDLIAPVPLLDGLVRAPAAPETEPRPVGAGTWGWTIGHLEAPAARLLVAAPGAQRCARGQRVGRQHQSGRLLVAAARGDRLGGRHGDVRRRRCA